MSVLIKDIPLAGYEISIMRDGDKWRARVDGIWCEVEEVPTPHGRLIDADKIDYRNDAMHDGTGHLVVADNFMNGVMWINDCIDNTPTVIEAEE